MLLIPRSLFAPLSNGSGSNPAEVVRGLLLRTRNGSASASGASVARGGGGGGGAAEGEENGEKSLAVAISM